VTQAALKKLLGGTGFCIDIEGEAFFQFFTDLQESCTNNALESSKISEGLNAMAMEE
jgi:ribonuclease HI